MARNLIPYIPLEFIDFTSFCSLHVAGQYPELEYAFALILGYMKSTGYERFGRNIGSTNLLRGAIGSDSPQHVVAIRLGNSFVGGVAVVVARSLTSGQHSLYTGGIVRARDTLYWFTAAGEWLTFTSNWLRSDFEYPGVLR